MQDVVKLNKELAQTKSYLQLKEEEVVMMRRERQEA